MLLLLKLFLILLLFVSSLEKFLEEVALFLLLGRCSAGVHCILLALREWRPHEQQNLVPRYPVRDDVLDKNCLLTIPVGLDLSGLQLSIERRIFSVLVKTSLVDESILLLVWYVFCCVCGIHLCAKLQFFQNHPKREVVVPEGGVVFESHMKVPEGHVQVVQYPYKRPLSKAFLFFVLLLLFLLLVLFILRLQLFLYLGYDLFKLEVYGGLRQAFQFREIEQDVNPLDIDYRCLLIQLRPGNLYMYLLYVGELEGQRYF